MVDRLARLCLLFTLVPVVAFIMCIRGQYVNVQKKTYRLTVLCVRTALFLPLYALLMFASVLFPNAHVLLIVVITIVEGYSFYCFFVMITTNLGGPAATIDLMNQSQRKLFCSPCCPSDMAVFYQRTTWAIFHLFVTRSILGALAAVCFYSKNPSGKAAFSIINTISAVVLFYGVASLVNLYENVFEHCTNLFGIVKLVLLKISVGAIVLQGLIQSFLYSSGTSPFEDGDEHNAEEKTLRAYCALVLAEFLLMSIVYYYAFGYKVITASPVSYKTASGENMNEARDIYNYVTSGGLATSGLLEQGLAIGPGGERQHSTASTNGIHLAAIANTPPPTPGALQVGTSSRDYFTNGVTTEKPRFPFYAFVVDVLRLTDVYGALTYRGDRGGYQHLDEGEHGDDLGELR